MKTSIFACFSILCLAGTAAAQQQQQTDSTPPAQGWVQLTSGTTAGFDCISLVGADTVYVGGEVLLRSTDAGITWQRATNAPKLGGYGYVHFFDSYYGFLCGSTDAVYRTTDGGSTWDTERTGAVTEPIAPAQGQIAFGSRQNGVIDANPGVYTNDSGKTWHSAAGEFPYNALCIIYADSLHAYAGGKSEDWGYVNGQPRPEAPQFDRSSDGGVTWAAAYPGPAKDLSGVNHTGLAKDVYGLAAIGSNFCRYARCSGRANWKDYECNGNDESF